MILNKKIRPELVCAPTPFSQAARNCYLDVDEEVLVALNETVMLRIPVELHPNDTSGIVTLEAIKLSRKKANIQHIYCENSLGLYSGTVLERPQEKFPPWKGIWDFHFDVEPNTCQKMVSAKLLGELIAAMGKPNAMVISMGANNGVNKPRALFFVAEDPQSSAILMPII